MRNALVIIQTLTFVALGALLITEGAAKLGCAQLLLGGVTVLVYS
jgi:hypothetical protein